jgi:hypothetical protein
MTIYRGGPMTCFRLAAAVVAGCSGGNGPPAAAAAGGGGATVMSLDTNPDGIAYPSPATGYGRNFRSGSTPGSIIANYKFSGYLNAVAAPELQTIGLADFYDPCGKRYKVIHLTVAARWCEPCNEETDAIEAAKSQLDAEGVVVVQALEDGTVQGTGATKTDLDDWIAQHHTTFTEVLDPDPNPQLGVFFSQASIPWNGDIDPRTMEILDSSPGWSGDVMTEVSPALTAVQSPANYPLPAACSDQ